MFSPWRVLAATLAAAAGLCVPAATAAADRRRRREHVDRRLRRGPDLLRQPRPGLLAVQGPPRRRPAREPLLGWPARRREAPSVLVERPARRRLRLVGLRPHRVLRRSLRDQAAVLDHGHAALGERRPELEPAAAQLRVAPRVRLRRGRALQRNVRRQRRPGASRRPAVGCVERAEQPQLPPAPVREGEGQVGDPERPRLRQDLQRRLRRRARDAVQGRAGRLRRHRAARQQQPARARGRRSHRSPFSPPPRRRG